MSKTMNLNKLKITLICGFIAVLFTSTFAQTEADAKSTAKSTVEKFYKFYATRTGVVSTHELNLIKPRFTPELTKLFQNEIKREAEFTKKNTTDKPHFGDGFPFNPYEECVVDDKVILNKIEIGEVKIEANNAMVEVKFIEPKECGGNPIETYKIELLKSKKSWLINDWIYADETKLTDDLNRRDY
jgi:hypothetical protein